MHYALCAALLCGIAASATATSPGFDPRQHRAPLSGQPTAVMVLGSPHISGLPQSFDPANLSLLIDRLAAWKPTRIAVEGLSGQQCDLLRRYKAQIPAAAETYCMDPSAAGVATGLDVPAALAEADAMLAKWPLQPTAADRRRLALVFLAAGERAPALVQWLRLPPAERRAADGLTPELVRFLDETITRRNENYLVAAVLAARLGHEKLWLMDDHSADILLARMGDDYDKAMMEVWGSAAANARRAANEKKDASARSPRTTLDLFGYYNDPAEGDRAFSSDFGAAMAHGTPQQFGRRYLGWWETRNLRMAANIREAAAEAPGGRLLVLTGASHKPYLDAYLELMHDLKLESPLPLLK